MQQIMSRVLMVDDAGLFRLLETSFLRRLGCEIVRAHDGPDLVRKARDRAPSLILIDTDSPDLDGPECVRALKSDPALRLIPVLVVTTTAAVASCCDAGADATLTRPVESGALELALSSFDRAAQRQGRRRTARGWVRVAVPGGLKRGRLKDISRTGLFLALPDPLPVHSRIGVSLRLMGPQGEHRVCARGVVVRQVTRDPDSHLIPGVGVRFIEIDPRDEERIDHYVGTTVLDGEAAPDRIDEDVNRS